MCHFWTKIQGVTKKTAPPILLNFSGYKYAGRLEPISDERWDP